MNLAIDIGNTRTKVGIFDNNELIDTKIFDEIFVCDIEFVLQNYTEVNHCIVSSVGELSPDIADYLENTFPGLIILSGKIPLPFVNEYESKQTQGPDRIAAIAGAQFLFPNSNSLVIDAGTAIKYDFIDSKGVYKGGNISPGLELRFKALHNFTEKLPLLNKEDTTGLLGRNTKEAIVSGVQQGIIFEMEGYVNRIQHEYPGLTIIITGGDADFFANQLKKTIFVNSNLVLIGLNRILEYNVIR
jgi:type III pantothenate kinase